MCRMAKQEVTLTVVEPLTERLYSFREGCYFAARPSLTIAAKSAALRLAPPTSAPSISGCDINSTMLAGLTLPPYWMRMA